MAETTEQTRQTQRLHIKLEDMDLQDMIDELTAEAWRAAFFGEPDPASAKYRELRRALEGVLRRHVVAFDICGLAAICREATEVDPWEKGA